MKKFTIIILALLLCGCSRSYETNDLAYVVAIGIDKGGEAGVYDFTLQIANPQAISGGSDEKGGEGGKETVSNLTVTAPNIYAAVNLTNHIYSKNVSLAHTKLIVVAEEIARSEGLALLSETIARNEEIRPSTYLSVVKKTAKDYLENIEPTNEVNPVKYYEVIYESDYSGFIPKQSCRDFYVRSLSPESENVLPLSATVEEGEEGTQNNDYDGFEFRIENYTAGEIEMEGDIKTQTCGMAIFKNDVMIAEAGGVEVELYNMLTDKYERSEITYPDKNDPELAISVVQTKERSPKINVDISGANPKIKVNIYLEADLRTVSKEYIVEQEQEDFEQQVSEQVEAALTKFLEKTAHEYQSDIVGFGSYIKHNFKSFTDFEDYNWQEKYKNAEFEVSVDFHLRRSGLINKKKG